MAHPTPESEKVSSMTTEITAARGALSIPRREKRNWNGWAFVGPFMVVFALVFLTPLAYALYLSFFQEKLIGGTAFVGLDNYVRALTDPQFWEAFGRVLLFLVVQVPIMLALALGAALALDSARLRGASFFRILIFLPYAVPAVVAVLMWGYIYGDQFGLAGNVNDLLGFDALTPFAKEWMLASIGNIVTWEFVGYNMLIFFSALQAVPQEQYEAAEIDGAGALRTVFSIKLPAIRGAIVVATIFSIIGSFQLFNEPAVLQKIAPNAISSYFTPNMYAFNLSFAGSQFNYAAAIAIISGVITMIIAFVAQSMGSKEQK